MWQEYIKALREGDYTKAISLVPHLQNRFETILGRRLRPYELQLLLMHQVAKSGIQREDLSHFNHLLSVSAEQNSKFREHTLQLAIAAIYAVKILVANQEEYSNKEQFLSTDLSHKDHIESFLQEELIKSIDVRELKNLQNMVFVPTRLTADAESKISAHQKVYDNQFEPKVRQATAVKTEQFQELEQTVAGYSQELKKQWQALVARAYKENSDRNYGLPHPLNPGRTLIALTVNTTYDAEGGGTVTRREPFVTYGTAQELADKILANLSYIQEKPDCKYPLIEKGYKSYHEEFGYSIGYVQQTRPYQLETELLQSGLAALFLNACYRHQAQSLLRRSSALQTFSTSIQAETTVSPEIKQRGLETIQTIKQNEPSWFEKPFIDRLTDVLSLGLKPLIKHLFLKPAEKILLEKTEETLTPKSSGPSRS